MIKQNFPTDDDSAMFEIFNRLNTGGIILKPQEIRTSLYHSKFYNQLYKLNLNKDWRTLLNQPEPDIHMKDVEILLRGFALLLDSNNYSPSMTQFLNAFSKKSRNFTDESLDYFRQLFETFCTHIAPLGPDIFSTSKGKFNITVFESIFVALTEEAAKKKTFDIKDTTIDKINLLKLDTDFINATQDNTAGKRNVETRLRVAKQILI